MPVRPLCRPVRQPLLRTTDRFGWRSRGIPGKYEKCPDTGCECVTPVTTAVVMRSMPEIPDDPKDARPHVVFFVDDDEELHRAVSKLLEHRGFEVVGAHSANQAFEVLETYKDRIDVLLMDINLPDGWGATVAQRLLEIRPGMAVVYTTGFHEEDPVLAGGLNDAAYVIRKPFSADDLTELLGRAIREEGG